MQSAQEIVVMHPNQSVRFNAASIVGVVAVSASVKKTCWLNWSLIMSHAPLALKPSASALIDFVRFNVTSAEEVLRSGTC